MLAMAVTIVTKDTFDQEVAQSTLPVLVDFYADWCGPCKMVAPLVEQISNEYGEEVKVAKINIDDAQELAAQHGVASIPTLILFKDGNKADQLVGAVPKPQIEEFVKKNI